MIRRWFLRVLGFGTAMLGAVMTATWVARAGADFVDFVGGLIVLCVGIGLWEASGRTR